MINLKEGNGIIINHTSKGTSGHFLYAQSFIMSEYSCQHFILKQADDAN